MAKIDFILDIFDAVSRKDWDRLVESGEELADQESKLKHHSVASRIRDALETMKRDLENDDSVIVTDVLSQKGFEYLQRVDVSKPDDIFLDNKFEEEINSFYNEWKNEDKLRAKNLKPRNSVLLFGPPGSGKTLLAKHVAKELGLPLYIIRFDSLISSFLGQTSSNLKAVFEFAKYNRCVLFLDEIDAIAKSRTDSSELGELKRVVISLLQNIDSHDTRSLIIAATNHPQILDSAIWRRFEIIWGLSRPSLETINLMLKKTFQDLTEEQLDLASKTCLDLSGSDIKMIFEQAKRKEIISNIPSSEGLFLAMIEFHRRTQISQEKESDASKIMFAIQALKLFWDKKYTYSDLQFLSGVPHSTIHNKLKIMGMELS